MSTAADWDALDLRVKLLERQVAELLAAVAVAQPVVPRDASQGAAGTVPVRVSADDVSPMIIGFGQRKFDSVGVPIRPTVRGEPFEIHCVIGRTETLTFEASFSPDPAGTLAGLAVFVDYAPIQVAVTTSQTPPARTVVTGMIPPDPRRGQVAMIFALPAAPAGQPMSGPEFYEIKFAPVAPLPRAGQP
jgi:hypothetical protein